MKFLNFLKNSFKSFTVFEWILWLGSLIAITLSFILAKNPDYLNLATSLVGACALIFFAKGNVIGQFIMIAFGILYAIISYSYAYYGEMITYLGMNLPTSVVSIVSWLKHSFNGNHAEVKINTLKKREYPVILALTTVVTVAFYFILRALGTSNLWVSTLSVFTSFSAAALSIRRSPFYALAYMFNDIVLIALWALATAENISYLPVTICFAVFLINDLYGLINWLRLKRKQQTAQSLSEQAQ